MNEESWAVLSQTEQEKFSPICPDFVIEMGSCTDTLELIQAKMQEYLDSGLQLRCLVNPQQQQTEIYRSTTDIEIVEVSARLSR